MKTSSSLHSWAALPGSEMLKAKVLPTRCFRFYPKTEVSPMAQPVHLPVVLQQRELKDAGSAAGYQSDDRLITKTRETKEKTPGHHTSPSYKYSETHRSSGLRSKDH